MEPLTPGIRRKRMGNRRLRYLAIRTLVPLAGVAVLGCLPLTLGVGPANASPMVPAGGEPAARVQQEELIRALIVRYERGSAPRGRVLGATRVTGSQRTNLVLGSALGDRMWRVDFRTPVDEATAKRVARQLASHPAVDFVELDRKVTAFRTTT